MPNRSFGGRRGNKGKTKNKNSVFVGNLDFEMEKDDVQEMLE